jgi:hypothetical protein
MRLCFAVLATMTLTASAGAASAQSGSATMTGTVLTAISITGTDLRFGNVMATQTKVVPPATGGRFDITLAANAPVSVTYTLPSSLGPQVAIGAWAALYHTVNDPNSALLVPLPTTTGTFNTSSPTGQMYFWLGAAVTTTNAVPGSYSAPITFTLTYN